MNRTRVSMLVLLAGFFSLSLAQEKTPPPAAAKSPAAEKSSSALTVTAAALGTDVQERKLVGEATHFSLNQKVYLWLALAGGPADEIVVTWTQGDKSYETKLKVGGTTWHTWASTTAAVAGPWGVTVSDAAGTVLKKLEFTVGGE
jgi:hypothetical protein